MSSCDVSFVKVAGVDDGRR